MRSISVILLICISAACSCNSKSEVTDANDYDSFLVEGVLTGEKEKLEKEIIFWQKRLQRDTGSYVNMLELATQYLRDFRLTGNIRMLHLGDSLLRRSAEKLNHSDPEILYALSQQAIAQHRFRDAEKLANAAGDCKGDKYTVRLLQFDAAMELGNYHEAIRCLETLKDKNAFDYLIRKAKWEDHKGNLEEAIALMEQAFEKVKDKKKSLYCWALSNLADMYGHAGRIEQSYKAYLRVLQKDPANLYCLKGIARIAYAHDGNTPEAKRILQYILGQTEMPDIRLLLAEIAEYEKDSAAKDVHLKRFLATVQQPGYGDMYNKYLIQLYAEEYKDQVRAEALAKKELSSRFTPETCDWMAWVYYQQGELDQAYNMAKYYVQNLTFEPDAILHTAYIYAAQGRKNEAKKLLEECLESAFELGPVVAGQIREKLQSL